jgi:mannosyl-oligosaccharide alpha-1,2-mannosidase
MFRFRRYRVFLAFAIIAVIALYKFGASSTAWREAASNAAGAAGLKSDAKDSHHKDTKPRPAVALETKSLKLDVPAATTLDSLQTPPPVKKPLPSSSSSPAVTEEQKPTIPRPIRPQPPHGNLINADNGLDSSASSDVIHWSKLPQRFPVPSESLIRLPSGKPKPIPKIQAQFKSENAAAKQGRIAKLDKIRSVAKKSWDGYKKYAWLHDELKPQSGTFRDPFANWGATLVDALDTLWIMGLKDEFEEAVQAVGKIDFTTTTRADIPLFETTIRYLGGLVAAYDLSDKKYKTLLDKAVELAEVLISAFDTPNRMPETYYYWRPDFASQSHHASQRVVLAEIGSLSMEFTRLAQLTGEHKYYDAIARITDNLEEFQNQTLLPGMWPTYLDVSGCGKKYIDMPSQKPQKPLKAPDGYLDSEATTDAESAAPSPTEKLSPEGNKYIPLELPSPVLFTSDLDEKSPVAKEDSIVSGETGKAHIPTSDLPSPDTKKNIPLELPEPVLLISDLGVAGSGTKEDAIVPGTAGKGQIKDWRRKRQLDIDESESPNISLDSEDATPTPSAEPTKPALPECIPQGFTSGTGYGREEYTLGGMSDSTYEYLPKQYLLLDGQVEKYRTMYEQSMDVVKKHLLFRPMLPGGEDILFSGKLNVPSNTDATKVGDLTAENAHLTCFAGGMFGMGAKIFDRPEDLEIAKKLTEGCIWSYSMTPTGIMPESFEAAPCENKHECAWNETAYWEVIDPRYEARLETYKEQMVAYESQIASASSWYEAELAAMTAPPTPAAFEAKATSTLIYADTLDKRQLHDLMDEAEIAHMSPASTSTAVSAATTLRQNHDSVMGGEPEEGEGPPTRITSADIEELSPQPSVTMPYVYSPAPVLSHEEYVKDAIQQQRLPEGVTRLGARNYILRFVFSSHPFPFSLHLL